MKVKGYTVGRRVRKRIEEMTGCPKTIGGMGRWRFVGRSEIRLDGHVIAAAYNLRRMAQLAPAV